jgi:hypothetical protein
LFKFSFLCSVSEDERWLFVLLILVELMAIIVQTFIHSHLILTHWTQTRKFKQWWSSIPPISTKQSPLKLNHWTEKIKFKQ